MGNLINGTAFGSRISFFRDGGGGGALP